MLVLVPVLLLVLRSHVLSLCAALLVLALLLQALLVYLYPYLCLYLSVLFLSVPSLSALCPSLPQPVSLLLVLQAQQLVFRLAQIVLFVC